MMIAANSNGTLENPIVPTKLENGRSYSTHSPSLSQTPDSHSLIQPLLVNTASFSSTQLSNTNTFFHVRGKSFHHNSIVMSLNCSTSYGSFPELLWQTRRKSRRGLWVLAYGIYHIFLSQNIAVTAFVVFRLQMFDLPKQWDLTVGCW